MLRAILNKSWKQHPTKKQLYRHLPPILKTIQTKRIRYTGHCWRCKDELKNHILLWASSHGRVSVGRPARTYLQKLSMDTRCSLEDMPEAMDDRDGLPERELGNSYKQHNMVMIYIYIIYSFDVYSMPKPSL